MHCQQWSPNDLSATREQKLVWSKVVEALNENYLTSFGFPQIWTVFDSKNFADGQFTKVLEEFKGLSEVGSQVDILRKYFPVTLEVHPRQDVGINSEAVDAALQTL